MPDVCMHTLMLRCFHNGSIQTFRKLHGGHAHWQRETYQGDSDSGGQTREKEECPFSGVTSYSRVWSNSS